MQASPVGTGRAFAMKPLRVVLVIVGALVGLLALSLVAGGGALLWAATEADADGYLSTDAAQVTSPSYAIVSEPLELTIGSADWLPKNIATLRVTIDDPDQHFVGIAPTADVRRYLSDVPYSRVTDLESDPVKVFTAEVPGSASPTDPRGEDFWAATAHDGTLTWDVRGGRWSLVVMNADASQGVDAMLSVGVKTALLTPIGIALLVVGVLFGIGAIVLIVSSVRHRAAKPLAPGETPTRPDVPTSP
jgi:hypothetical protein